ncbi:hypothetical protein ABIF66_002346 [Bradyrhizobium japonicum]
MTSARDLAGPDSRAAIAFLESVYPRGPWLLTAIRPDKKAVHTKTFGPAAMSHLREWLDEHNGTYNIYWSVNPPIEPMEKKASTSEIASVNYLHVDIDPRAGEDLTAERDRILSLLTEKLPEAVPAPSIVLFSGGGFQAFWKLRDPIEIDGQLTRAEEAKRYNRQLELVFGGDSCHDIARIMRLPGTVNIPDERKRRRGRLEQLAYVEHQDMSLVYELKSFVPAPTVQLRGSTSFEADTTSVVISGNVARLEDVNDLDKYHVGERIKIAIAQGEDPENPKPHDNSRSAWLMHVVCELVRRDVPDDVIFSIITDPEFKISASVIDKGSNAQRYAVRQIERAKFFVIDPKLLDLNEQFAVIQSYGGKCRVVEETFDPVLNRARLIWQSFEDFRNRYLNETVECKTANGRTTYRPLGKWWLEHRMRRQFRRVVFAPGLDVPGCYNLWQGYAFEPLPGSLHESFLAHIRDNVCQQNARLYEYFISWMARAVQRPGEPGQVAIVLRGGKGVGKSFVAKEFGKLFGRHFLQVSNPSHLVGNFNAHLRDVVVLFADEAFYAGDKKHESILKTLITEETIQIEAKGIDAETAANFVHLIMASNETHVVRASGDERRFFVLDVGSDQQKQSSYFGQIASDLDSGGYQHLLHFLLRRDLSNFDVRQVPQTGALRDQQMNTLESFERLVFEMIDRSELPFVTEWIDGLSERTRRPFVATSELQLWAQAVLKREVSEKRIGESLKAMGAEPVRRRIRGWMLPFVQEARQNWDRRRFKADWDDAVEWQTANGQNRWTDDAPF